MCDPTPSTSSPGGAAAASHHQHSPGHCYCGAASPSSPRRTPHRPPSAATASAFTCGICLADEVAEAGILDSCEHR